MRGTSRENRDGRAECEVSEKQAAPFFGMALWTGCTALKT